MPDYNFWNERWEKSEIGFNLAVPHRDLVRFIDKLKGHKKVFVPLCGKSIDMIYLREHGLSILGVEFSEIAVLQFLNENKLKFNKTHLNDFILYQGEGFSIYQGDIFKMRTADLKGVTACYDRASMVAFNKEERKKYAQFLCERALDLEMILSPLLDYGDIAEVGPPYSVTEIELNELYGKTFALEKLKSSDVEIRESLKSRGAPYEREVTWYFKKLSKAVQS